MFDVLIIGAGPAGLAAAIAAKTCGLRYLVIEKGALVHSLLHYPTDMVFFTTPELMEIGGLPFVTPYDKPTRREALRYYRRVADTFDLDVAFDEPVAAIARTVEGTFRVTSRPAHHDDEIREARAVVVATGAYDVANMLDVPGEGLSHVSHYYTGAHPHYRRHVVVVGGKNSAAEAALDLYRAGAHVTLVHRGASLGDSLKYWVKPDIENRIAEGTIAARFESRLIEIRAADVVVDGPDGRAALPAHAVFLLTGYRSDTTLLRSAGAEIDEVEGAPVHDTDTLETTVPGLYVIGACVAGRQSGRIFIENGRFHGEVAVRHLADRLAAHH